MVRGSFMYNAFRNCSRNHLNLDVNRRLLRNFLSTQTNGNRKDAGESVFRKFAENMKQQEKDDSLKTDMQKFEEKLTELRQNETIKKARETLSKVKEDVLRQNAAVVEDVKEKAQAVKQVVGKVAGKVSNTISVVSKPVRDVADIIKPYVPDIKESEVVKKVANAAADAEEKILDSTNAYQYGGFKNRELREKSKQKLNVENENVNKEETKTVEANPEAGNSVIVHKESAWSSRWNNFVENNRILQRVFGLRRSYEESNNIFVYFARQITDSISDRIASVFSEGEAAKAIREIQARDPSFNIESFMKLATQHIFPEILDALLIADFPTLRMWCSESCFNVVKSSLEVQLTKGARAEGKILDLRHIELAAAKLLDNTPVLVFTFNTQQISLIRSVTGEIIAGSEEAIENITYVMALAKEELPMSGKINPITQGWKLVELAMTSRSGTW